MDRSIPHVRDIFAPYRSTPDSSRDHRIHVYEHSPGSRRRRHDAKDESTPQDFIDTDHSDSTDEGPTLNTSSSNNNNNNREQQRVRDKTSRNNNTNATNRNSYSEGGGGGGGGYSSKTLTERDIRHLERHLSMKKTIRKQISRNLAQAFVDDDAVFRDSEPQPAPPCRQQQQQRPLPPSADCTFTLTRAKMAARSEHTFLDMLKKDSGGREADSGHSSPSHQGGFDDAPMELDLEPPPPPADSRPSYDQQVHCDQNKKQSFWKKLGFKGKAKR